MDEPQAFLAGKSSPREHLLAEPRLSPIFPTSGMNLEMLPPKTVDEILQLTK